MALSTGDITISNNYKATYVASWAAFVPAALNMFSFVGPTTKVIKILRVGMSGTQTISAPIKVLCRRAGSSVSPATLVGGVSVAPTGIVPFDSASPAPVGAPKVYTTAFTLSGGSARTFKESTFAVQTTTPTYAYQPEYIFDFINDFGCGLIVDINTILLLNFATSPAGFSLSMWVEWTEE